MGRHGKQKGGGGRGGGLAASLRAMLGGAAAKAAIAAATKGGSPAAAKKLVKKTAAGLSTATSIAAIQKQARQLDQLRRRVEQETATREAAEKEAKAARARDGPVVTALRDRYRPEKRTLLVGEGNLSFALALARTWAAAAPAADAAGGEGEDDAEAATDGPVAANLVATVYDRPEDLRAKYAEAADNAAALEALGATVRYGVDATKLHTPAQIALHGCAPGSAYGAADVVAFHFPHAGLGIKDQDRNIRANQQLLLGFFASAKLLLAPPPKGGAAKRAAKPDDDDDDGDGEGAKRPGARRRAANKKLAAALPEVGDGGGEIHVTVRRGEPYDSWQIVKLARSVGLALVNAVRFDPRAFPGYEHRRTIGAVPGVSNLHNEEIMPKRCVTYIFQRGVPPPLPANAKRAKAA